MRSDNRSGNVWIYPCRHGFRIYFRVGGRMNGTKVFRRREEAEAEADRIRSEITMRSRTVRSAFGVFKAEMVARELGAKTIERVERDAFRLLAPVLDEPLSALTNRRAESLYEALATSGKYLASTHRMSLKVCRQFGAWCAHPRRRWLRANPFASVEKLGKVADHRSESLRINEARAFRDKAVELGKRGDTGAVAALLALLVSLRPSEIVQISARDVDDGGKILWIAGRRLKTENTRRPMEIVHPELSELLVLVAAGKSPAERLFPHGPHFPTRAAHRIAQAIGLDPTSARTLRRTFASLAARTGRSLDAVAFGMGHGADTNATTAQRHYIAPGARDTGAARRVLGVLDGGTARKHQRRRERSSASARGLR